MNPTAQANFGQNKFLPGSRPGVEYSMPPSQYHHVGPTGPGYNVFMNNKQMSAAHPRTPYYCTYIPAPTFQFPVIPGVSESQRASPESPPLDESLWFPSSNSFQPPAEPDFSEFQKSSPAFSEPGKDQRISPPGNRYNPLDDGYQGNLFLKITKTIT